jgi:hypothetical protein
LEDAGVDGKILKWIFRKRNGIVAAEGRTGGDILRIR